MGHELFFVVLHDAKWKISLDGRHSAPYPSRTGAVRAAIEAAHLVCDIVGNAQVLVQQDNKQFKAEWTHGRDPYRPEVSSVSRPLYQDAPMPRGSRQGR